MRVIRTFHPVGQGAFYTEVFLCGDGNRHVVVYDCGTETGKNDMDVSLENQINTFKNHLFLHGITKIDILFISHFHADHINGLKWLLDKTTVDKTVIPMLDLPTITVTRVQNYLRFDFDTAQEADNIIQEIYLGGEKTGRFGEVVMVSPYFIDEPQKEKEGAASLIDNGNTILSGMKVKPGKIWEYIPFNSIDRNDSRAQILLVGLKNLANGQQSLGYLIRSKLKEVKDLYSKTMGHANHNLYTLVVTSKPVDGIVPQPCPRLSHCIYFGDFDYHQNNDPWARLNKVIKYDEIGTVQVPHHGARGNWHPDMVVGDPRHYIVSSGSTNRHHHPNYWVLEEIWDKGHRSYVVSEKWQSGREYLFEVN